MIVQDCTSSSCIMQHQYVHCVLQYWVTTANVNDGLEEYELQVAAIVACVCATVTIGLLE